MTRVWAVLALLTLTSPLALAVTTAHAQEAGPLLRADVNRDGAISQADDSGEDRWTRTRGAIVLPNLDDDRASCPKRTPDGKRLSDDALASCHDAADNEPNGKADLEDLARLRVEPMPNVDDGATITLTADHPEKVRIFADRGDGWRGWHALNPAGRLTVDELEHGVDLAIEARDIVRDAGAWNGLVDLTLSIQNGNDERRDTVRTRVAPALFVHDLMPIEQLMVSDNGTKPRTNILGHRIRKPTTKPEQGGGESAYRAGLRRGLDQAGITAPLVEYATGGDIWVQDMFEPGYVSMPAVGGDGAEHRIRLYVRSANESRSGNPTGDRPLREGSRSIFTQLRGKDVGAVQQYDPDRFPPPDEPKHPDTFNSTGNFGAIPPYRHAGRTYPTGRMLYGARDAARPDPTFTKLLHAQGYQDPVVVDTSWLAVGHVDEFLTFLPADTPRGWVLGVADPRLADRTLRKLVEDGHGDRPLVNGVAPGWDENPGMTVRQALRKPSFQKAHRIASNRIDRALDLLKEQTGITEAEIVRLPVLFNEFGFDPRRPSLYAYLPDAANGISTGTDVYLAPRQHGPRVEKVDVFERLTERALERHDVQVAWVEDWKYSHVGVGEIHCVTNAERDLTGNPAWWTEAYRR